MTGRTYVHCRVLQALLTPTTTTLLCQQSAATVDQNALSENVSCRNAQLPEDVNQQMTAQNVCVCAVVSGELQRCYKPSFFPFPLSVSLSFFFFPLTDTKAPFRKTVLCRPLQSCTHKYGEEATQERKNTYRWK